MDFISSSKNIGSSAFGSSSSGSSSSGSGAGGEGGFSSFFNLSIQKMVLILAIAKCPDRLQFDGTNCVDPYGLGYTLSSPSIDNCVNFNNVKASTYSGSGLSGVDGGYVAWEGIVDGQKSRAASLKCLS